MMLRIVLLSLLLISPAMAQRVPVPPERPASIPRTEEVLSPGVQPSQVQEPALIVPAPAQAQKPDSSPFVILYFFLIVAGILAVTIGQIQRSARAKRRNQAEAAALHHEAQTGTQAQLLKSQPAARSGCFPIILAGAACLAVLIAGMIWIDDVTLTPQQRAARVQAQEIQRTFNQIRRDRQTLEARAQETIRQSLRDPSSAQFRHLFAFLGTQTVCGEVNGRNAFGGLTGFQPFIVINGTPFIREGTRQQILQFEEMFRSSCILNPN